DDGKNIEVEERSDLWVMDKYEPKGNNGFGYDPIVYPLENGKPAARTYSELSPNEKNNISHRGQALKKIVEKLLSQQVSPVAS
ncbi:MAG: non-canonical purine NTP pyrophosphatase, partial [Vampirovibrio sp.]|nr:non-canonical purine NTP pyrophosphatase [Vampirovibrio sp.]